MASFEDFGASAPVEKPKQLSTRDKNLRAIGQAIPASDDRDDLTIANFNELEGAIAKQKDPKLREILVTEHNRLKGQLNLNDTTGDSLTKSKFMDFSEEGAPSPTIQALKAMGGEAAAVGDFIWGFATMPLGVGADLGARAAAIGSGETRRIGAQAGREGSAYVQQQVGNPFQKFINLFDSGEAYEKAKTTQGMKWLSEKIDEFGSRVENLSGGKVLKEDVASMVDTLMASAGVRGGAAAARVGKVEPKIDLNEKQPQARRPGTRDPGVEDAEIISEQAKPKAAPTVMLPNKEQGSLFDTRKDAARFSEQDLKAIGMTRDQLKNTLDEAALPDRMKFLTATAGAGAAGIGGMMLYQWLQEQGDKPAIPKIPGVTEPDAQPNEDGNLLARAKDTAPWLLGPGIAMAGAVKGPGGMWHPEAVGRLAGPLGNKLSLRSREHLANIGRNGLMPDVTPNAVRDIERDKAALAWSDKAIRNYLNKYAGTERDPLKDVEIPDGERTAPWGELFDLAITPHKFEGAGQVGDLPVRSGETVFELKRQEGGRAGYNPPMEGVRSTGLLSDYLSHVGDYLRQNVKPEELHRYDLVRAVKETSENDKRVAHQMEKAASASMKDLPVYKEYKDGFKWVELKLPQELTADQVKQVRQLSKTELQDLDIDYSGRGDKQSKPSWAAVDSAGKPLENTFTKDIAVGHTPEEAWLAGRLAEEGNSMGHCVGGYCEGVAAGDSKIYSLRDAKGKSHVTVEVQDNPQGYGQPIRGQQDLGFVGRAADKVRVALEKNKEIVPDIIQIKGKQNRAPSKEYLPYVQDFVKSGEWGEVGDLENASMVDVSDRLNRGAATPRSALAQDQAKALGERFKDQRYVRYEDWMKAIEETSGVGAGEFRLHSSDRGSIDIRSAAKLAAIGLGAAAGAYLSQDNPLFGAAVGAGSVLAAFALRRPDNILRKEVGTALASMREAVHPTFYASTKDRTAAKLGEAVIASNIAKKMQHDSAVYHSSEGPRRYWEKAGPQKGLAFIIAFEQGRSFADPVMKAMGDRYRAWSENLYAHEKGLGIEYESRDHYIYHSFENPEGLAAHLTKKYGTKWGDPTFTKDRKINLYEEAIRAGFKPKSLNPEVIHLNRQYASNIAEMRINMLSDLRKQGLARLKGEEHLATGGEVVRRAPNGKIYYVDPRAELILHNAFDTKGLWERKDALGSGFRLAMEMKNLTVPIILSGSLFHPFHLALGMNSSAAMLRANKLLSSGNLSATDWTRMYHRSVNPVSMVYDAFWTDPKEGWRPYQVWKGKIAEKDLTAADSEILERIFDGGFIPEPGNEWRAKSAELFQKALDQRSIAALPLAIPAIMQLVGKPMMEIWIPQLKLANYIKDTEAALKANPKLRTDQAARMVAFRKIGKSVENRFGEMAYSTLFWPKMIKDIGIGMSLSLGWTLGFFREYGGGVRELGHGVINMTKDGKLAKGELDRATFVMQYTAISLLSGGLLTWVMSGTPPQEWLDYVYPRTGDKGKDGKPARVNTMFYTRELIGMWKHMQNEGVLAGTGQFMLNKVAPTWGIAKGLWTNLDYFNKEISNPDAPAFQRMNQKVKWALSELSPISVQGIKKGDGSAKNIALSIAGFSPAPRYATETPLEGKIASMYRQYHPSITPYDRVQRGDVMRELRQLKQSGDNEKFREKLGEAKKNYGLTYADGVRLERDAKTDSTERMFRSLSVEHQRQLINKMNADEKQRFLPYANKKLKRSIERE